MADLMARLVGFLEDHRRIRPLQKAVPQPTDGFSQAPITICVIGGGLAGPAFARRALSLAGKLGRPLRIELLTRPACNYCAGLVTDLARQTMSGLYEIVIPSNIIKESIYEVVYLNRHGLVAIPLAAPLTSVLRTNRFKQLGFDDTWLDSVFTGLKTSASFTAQRNVRVTAVKRKETGRRFSVYFEKAGQDHLLDADFVVLATGLKSIPQPVIQSFIEEEGYRPPELMDACVTEVNTAAADYYDLGGRVLVVDGVIGDCIVALIPKGKGWLTVTGLGKVLGDHDLERIFQHPSVRRFIRMSRLTESLRCGKICSANVVLQPGERFFGDGWVMIGDLTGYGRALKDGYFAALQSADLAARTLLFHGPSAAAFRRHYLAPLKLLSLDNRIGIWLYHLDQMLINGRIGKLVMDGAAAEARRDRYGGLITAALRALFTGELSYKLIAGLFVSGLTLHLANQGLGGTRRAERTD